MDFLKKIFTKDTCENNDQSSESTLSNDTLNTPQNSPEESQPAPTTVNLMSKLFRTQKLSFSEPPEMLHDNEAWAPETGYVGLFRKRKINLKDNTTFSNP